MSSTDGNDVIPVAHSFATRVYVMRVGAERSGWTMPMIRVPQIGEKVSFKCVCPPPEGLGAYEQDDESLLLMTCRWWEVVEVNHCMLCEPTDNGFHRASQACWMWVKALPDYQPPE